MSRRMPFPLAILPLALAVCAAFGAVAMWLGMDANWDLRNYHWYNGWALVNRLVGRDVLVGQLATFYNPTIDAPFAWAAERFSARTVGFALGMVHGLNFLALFAIAWALFTISNPRRRFLVATAVALIGLCGGGALSEVGTVFYDNVVSLGVFVSIWIVVTHWDNLVDTHAVTASGWALVAGLPVGLAFGLKQPSVIYCVGLCAAFLVADMPLLRRIFAGFWFGIGVLLGFAVAGGPWALHLWQSFGNPLFPYFNHIFHSPWALPIPYRDDAFVPKALVDKLLFAFRFSFDSHLTAETEFRDFRVLAVLMLVPLAGLAGLWRRPTASLTQSGPTRWLLAAALITYAVWLSLFAIYRYLIPLEMLAPLLVVAAIGQIPRGPEPLGRALRQVVAVGVLGFLVVSTIPGDWLRVPWREQAVEVNLPPIDRPSETLVLLSGHEPLSFLIPAFPHSMRFLRIDSTFTLDYVAPQAPGALPPHEEPPTTGFPKLFRDTIAQHSGPIASLHLVAQQERDVVEKLAQYGLELDRPSCREVTSPIGGGTYAFCLTRRPNTRPTSGKLLNP